MSCGLDLHTACVKGLARYLMRRSPLPTRRMTTQMAEAPTDVTMSEVVMWNGDRRIQTQVGAGGIMTTVLHHCLAAL